MHPLLTILCFCLQMAKPQPFAGATASNLSPCSNMKTASNELPSPRKRINWKDSAGMKFGRLTCTGETYKNSGQMMLRVWCICSCGKRIHTSIGNLVRKHTKSCGCQKHDSTVARNTKHGHSVRGKRSKLYRTYVHMLERCHSETRGENNYKGRGIKVCDRWRYGENGVQGFVLFTQDMGEPPSKRHTIERQDNNGNYTPKNCIWATRMVQNSNKRSNRWIEYEGQKKTMAQWARATGLCDATISNRIKRGLPLAEVLFNEKEFWG